MRKSKGYRHGTRRLFKKHTRKKGLRPPDYLLRDFDEGKAYIVLIKQGRAIKKIIANREHLRLSRSVIQQTN
ncbi:MAG: hypothetical protein ACXAAM_02170 [Candidatus Heimdallarchaeaceae archaeon]|jgi:ribosomal protein L21E